jgi:hypothetical protein
MTGILLISQRNRIMGIAMLKKLFLAALLFLLAACTARPTAAPTPIANTIDNQEEAVYAALLPKLYSASSFVIMDTTATDVLGVDNTAQVLDHALQNMYDVAPATVDSFRSRNDKAYPVRADMQIGVDYVLLTWPQRNQIFGQNTSGWEEFYNNYPQTPGITTLSRVGFNTTFDQALVYVGTQSNWLAGAGYYVLLKKVNGTWTIDQKVLTWTA